MRRVLILVAFLVAGVGLARHPRTAEATVYGYAGWATYYGIEDGVRAGDVMYDGTPYDPNDPTITSGSVLFPIHTWLLVCNQTICIPVQVRDRGYLDEFGVLLDLSRAAYYRLFGHLGGRQWISAYYMELLAGAQARTGAISTPPAGVTVAPAPGAAGAPPSSDRPPPPSGPGPRRPGKMQWQIERREPE